MSSRRQAQAQSRSVSAFTTSDDDRGRVTLSGLGGSLGRFISDRSADDEFDEPEGRRPPPPPPSPPRARPPPVLPPAEVGRRFAGLVAAPPVRDRRPAPGPAARNAYVRDTTRAMLAGIAPTQLQAFNAGLESYIAPRGDTGPGSHDRQQAALNSLVKRPAPLGVKKITLKN